MNSRAIRLRYALTLENRKARMRDVNGAHAGMFADVTGG
jgi:hypothetical protein